MQCRNCHNSLPDKALFCFECGEKLNPQRLTVKSLIGRVFQEFLDYDNKFLKTFRHLFSKPDLVIDSYVKGNRKSYVNVLTYLSISLTLIALQTFILKNFYPEQLNSMINTAGQDEVTSKITTDLMMTLFDYQGLMMIIFTPFSAITSWLAFIDEDYNLAEHVELNIYPAAQFFIIWFVISIPILALGLSFPIASLISMIALFVYMLYVFKRLFDQSWFMTGVRTLAYFMMYFFVYIVFFFVMGIAIGAYWKLTGKI